MYKLEFSAAITVDESLPTLTAQLAANQALNRTADCIPYDYNGVSVEGEYINASLCTGYKDRKYILTQGMQINLLKDSTLLVGWSEYLKYCLHSSFRNNTKCK